MSDGRVVVRKFLGYADDGTEVFGAWEHYMAVWNDEEDIRKATEMARRHSTDSRDEVQTVWLEKPGCQWPRAKP